MSNYRKFSGSLSVPGDKSITHRALIFSLLSLGECTITGLSPAADCASTIACIRALGVSVESGDDNSLRISSPYLEGLSKPAAVLDAGNSGTTIRLLSGLLAGTGLECRFDGDESLRKRPMARLLSLLADMGTRIRYESADGRAPFSIKGGNLKGAHFYVPIASAQLQSALLLAGLQASGQTSVKLPQAVRDHTERMFRYIGVTVTNPDPLTSTVHALQEPLKPFTITVPGDISSASFFMVAAACCEDSQITLTGVGINPGRSLILDVLREMGVRIEVLNERYVCNEPVADIHVKGSPGFGGTIITGDRLAAGIDEVPILALLGAFCDGTFSVRDAQELRVKESDRLAAITKNLRQAGVNVVEHNDGIDIVGSPVLNGGCQWKTYGDHRLAMTGIVASLLSAEPISVDDVNCVSVSYPDFARDLATLTS